MPIKTSIISKMKTRKKPAKHWAKICCMFGRFNLKYHVYKVVCEFYTSVWYVTE